MKIALVGNMNNNNFALMRYLRDLGADAHLLLYANDGQGSAAHFQPESDTWEIEKWAPYIHQTKIPNAPIAALDFPLSWMIGARSWIRSLVGLQDGLATPVSRQEIRKTYHGYDRLVASGITPATLCRTEGVLDIFYPYSGRIEFLENAEFLKKIASSNLFARRIYKLVQASQIKGIRAARNVLNYDLGVTQDALLKIGVHPKTLAVPLVYADEKLSLSAQSGCIKKVADLIFGVSLVILHHSRVMFENNGNFLGDSWQYENKNTDWVIRGYAQLIKERPNASVVLLMVEYGPDIRAAKALALTLGVADRIAWLPKMERRDLMWIVSRASVCCGEFYSYQKMLWGGTGWEALATGKPLLQGFNFEKGEFEQIYGYPPPPMLPVRKQEDILTHLLDMNDHPEKRAAIGLGAKEWFNRYNGIGLAKQWLDILMAPREDYGDTKKVTVNQGVHG